jgi:hypothetical protein
MVERIYIKTGYFSKCVLLRPTEVSALSRIEVEDKIKSFFKLLSPTQLSALYLQAQNGANQDEVAELLGISEKSANNILLQCRKKAIGFWGDEVRERCSDVRRSNPYEPENLEI